MRLKTHIFFSLIICLLAISTFAQKKKNSRPNEDAVNKKNESVTATLNAKTPVYFYEFSKPEFIVSEVFIEHDEEGKGKITFKKKDYDESFVEPIILSEKSLEKIKELWNEINFLASKEEYQSKRDYAHLGTMKLKMKRDQKERTTEFNWTDNAKVKMLTDEYRKIGNQSVWMFDMNISRENQPLETPRIMKTFDSYLRRNEISDPKQMIPYLKELIEDERIPLITRNHAKRLLKSIKK